jgi:hypothetical protein
VTNSGNEERPRLEGTLMAARKADGAHVLTLRLQNPGARAVHYISDIRAYDYDTATSRLTVRLTDEGRMLIPSAVGRLPAFRSIDPNSESELALELPPRIVRLGKPSPSGEIALEEQRLTDAAEIVVDVAWADTPFYTDPRESTDRRLPAARWQQGSLKLSTRVPA